MVNFRKLDHSEYDKLAKVGEGFIPPEASVTVVAEDQNEIVGRIFLLAPAHIEGPWIKEEYRGNLIAKGLVDNAEHQAKDIGITKLFAYAVDDQIADYMKRLGYTKWDVTVWFKEL